MKAYQYRIEPNASQRVLLAKHFGCARHIYNWALAQKNEHYEKTGKNLSRSELQRQIVASKKTDKPWLAEVNSQSLLAALLHLETAFQNFFQGRSRFPRFKSKAMGWQSFQCPQHVTIDFEENRINLPKLKGIKARLHRSFQGQIKTVTIKRSPSGKYTASVLVDEQFVAPVPTTIEPEQTLGLDVGIQHFFTDSNGKKKDNPKFLRQSLPRLRIAQKILSRKKKGSYHRAKQKKRVAILHEKVANQRYDFIQQLTAKLVSKNHATSFALEDLHIKGMVKNRKLSRAISDCGWGMFISTLRYKCQWYGKNLLTIDRFAPSSKTCSQCGQKQEKMPLSLRVWQCDCGTTHDRDHNAAIMIKHFAFADALGYSDCVKSSPMTKPVSAGVIAKGVVSNAARVVRSPHDSGAAV